MVAFKLLLSLALVSVALAQFPQATVDLSGEGLETGSSASNKLDSRVGKPFNLTCTFDPTLPEDDPNTPGMHGAWVAEVSFFMVKSSYDTEMKVFGTYKVVDECEYQYVTENYFPGVNVYPVTKMDPGMGMMGEMRTNFTVAVLATDASTAGGQYQCAVKLYQKYTKAGVKFFSNKINLQ